MMQKILARYGLPEDLVYVALIEAGSLQRRTPWRRRPGPGSSSLRPAAGTASASTGGPTSAGTPRSRRTPPPPTCGIFTGCSSRGRSPPPRTTPAREDPEGGHPVQVRRFLRTHPPPLPEAGDEGLRPKMLAALTIAKDPDKYGFGDVAYEAPLDCAPCRCREGPTWGRWPVFLMYRWSRSATGTPELRRFCTPPNREGYDLGSPSTRRSSPRADEEIRTQARSPSSSTTSARGNAAGAGRQVPDHGSGPQGVERPDAGLPRAHSAPRNPGDRVDETEAVPGPRFHRTSSRWRNMRVEEGSRRARIREPRRPEPGDAVTVRRGDTMARLAKRHGVR